MLFPLPDCLVRHLRHAMPVVPTQSNLPAVQPAFPSPRMRPGLVPAASLLLFLVAAFTVPSQAFAQVSFEGVQNTLASFPSSDTLSPVAVDANGDAFFVSSNGTTFELWEAPANGNASVINSNFPSLPSAIAVNPAGTALYFIYYGSTTNCNGGSIFIATAPVATGVPTNMPCSFTMLDGSSNFTVTYSNPTGLAVDPSGNLWIADEGGGDFFEIPAPVTATSVPTLAAALTKGQPEDIAVNGNGTVYFTILNFSGNSEIQEVASIPASSFTNNLGNSPVAATPIVTHVPSIQSGLAINPSGNLFLGGGDSPDSEIIGSALVSVDSDFVNGTEGLATDSNGDLFIAGADSTGTQYVVELNRQAASFGSQPVGQTTTARTLNFILTNTTIGSIGVLTAGQPNQDFAIASGTTCAAQAYTSATACVVNVTFQPSVPGLRMGALVLYSGANNTGSVLAKVPLYGTGTGPQVAYYPGTLSAIDPTVNSLQLKYPDAVFVDGAGDLFISDYSNNRVVKVPAGNGTPTAIDPSVNGKSLAGPSGVAVDGAGDLFISDFGNDRVVEVAIDGTLSAIAPVVNGLGFSGPYGIAVDGAGTLFVADEYNDRVVEVPSGGGTPTAIDPTVDGKAVGYPVAVAVDWAGNLYIADYLNSRVVEVPPGGDTPTAIAPAPNGQALDGVVGVAVDVAGDLYISNFFTSQIVEVPADGSAPTAIDTFVDGSAVFGPENIAVDTAGNLFIADYESWRIVEVQHSVPPTLNFPTPTPVGSTDTTDGPQTVQIVNIGNSTLTIQNLESTANPIYPPAFPVNTGQANLCSDMSYPPAASCYISAEFIPVSAGTNTGEITLIDTAFNQGDGTQFIPVTGANNQQTQTINFTPPASPVYYGVSPITLSATGGASGNAVTFSILSGPGNVSGINGGTLTITGPGTIVIAANQSGNNNYAAAVQVTQIVIVTMAPPATLTSPTPGLGTTLGSPNATFQWTSVVGASDYQLNLSAIGPGQSELFLYKGTATTATATTLPAYGEEVYATLYTKISGVWQSNSYVYYESGPRPAQLTSPTPGLSTILGPTGVTFQWTTGAEVEDYQLNLSAIGQGQSELYSYKGTATSAVVSALPANGATVYATLYSKISGVWQWNAYQYTESGTPTPATLTSPTPGLTTILGTSSVLFQWTAGGGASEFQLNLSAITPGASDLFLYKGTASSATVPMLPAHGVTVYATLYSKIQGTWQSNSYVYTESGSPTPAALTSPTPGLGTILGTTNVLFQWSAGTSASDYQLNLSTVAPGNSELYSYKGTALSATAPSLPANGVKVYARLYSKIDGNWLHNDYVYTEQ